MRREWGAAHICQFRVPSRLRIPPLTASIQTVSIVGKLGRWIRRYRPDAIIGFNAGILWQIQKAGYRVPEDIGFVSLHVDRSFDIEDRPHRQSQRDEAYGG